MRVALHTCCGPCALVPFGILAEEHEVVAVFANPNIQPADEYERRRDTLLAWAHRQNLPVEEIEAPGAWERATEGVRDNRAERCRRCYSLRIGLTAACAARLGCDALSTTLVVSPYQDLEAIEQIGIEAAQREGLTWVSGDYTARYEDAVAQSRALGMYRQNYCGCAPSKREAEAERDARRAARAGEAHSRESLLPSTRS